MAWQRLVFSMLRIQFTVWNLGRGVWRSAPPSREPSASAAHWRLLMQGWSGRKWILGTRSESGKRALGARGFEQPTFGALENGTNGGTDSDDQAAQETVCIFSFFLIACISLLPRVPPGPFFLLRRLFYLQVNSTFGLCRCRR